MAHGPTLPASGKGADSSSTDKGIRGDGLAAWEFFLRRIWLIWAKCDRRRMSAPRPTN